jgi:hypothetical protein
MTNRLQTERACSTCRKTRGSATQTDRVSDAFAPLSNHWPLSIVVSTVRIGAWAGWLNSGDAKSVAASKRACLPTFIPKRIVHCPCNKPAMPDRHERLPSLIMARLVENIYYQNAAKSGLTPG